MYQKNVHREKSFYHRFIRTGLLIASVSVGIGFANQASAKSMPGLHTYTMGHASIQNPSYRLGGPLKVEVTQENGGTRFILPGPRDMDPAVFGTPKNPLGFEPAPFPLLGVPLNMRNQANGKYTFVQHATPFSDWREVGVGSLHMTVVDATAMDGARTRDKINFEAKFQLPDGTHYRVVCKKALPHGMAFPTFGGVVTNHLLHGSTGIGTRLMPTEFTYVGFWGIGDIYREGVLINKMHLIHVMVTEAVRGDNYKLQHDGKVGNPPTTRTLHLMIPPYRPVPGKGMVKDPLKTNFMPFPFVKKHLMADMMNAKKSGDAKAIARMMAVKKLMGKTKEHVIKATKAGKMFGQPFIHIMFGNIVIKASRG